MPSKETKVEVEAGIPGVFKAKVGQTKAATKVDYRYSCSVSFDNPDDARNFRALVEKAVSDGQGRMLQSHLDNKDVPAI